MFEKSASIAHYKELEGVAKEIYPSLFAASNIGSPSQEGDSISHDIATPQGRKTLRAANIDLLEKAKVSARGQGFEVGIFAIHRVCEIPMSLIEGTKWEWLPVSEAVVNEAVAVINFVDVEAELEELVLVVARGSGEIGLVMAEAVVFGGEEGVGGGSLVVGESFVE